MVVAQIGALGNGQATPDQSFGCQMVGLGKAQNNALEHSCLAASVILSLLVVEWLSQVV